MSLLDKYKDKAADTFDDVYHKGLKGFIRRHPLTFATGAAITVVVAYFAGAAIH